MKVSVLGKVIDASLQERKVGNCRIFFRYEGRLASPVTMHRSARNVTKADAQAVVDDWVKRQGARPPAGAPGAPTAFRAAMEAHLKEEHSGQAGDQPRTSLERLGRVLGWPDVRTITKEMYREAETELMTGRWGKVNKPKSWRNVAGEHRHFAAWLVDEDLISKDFTRGVKLPGIRAFGRKESAFDESSFPLIRDALPPKWREVWEDAWFTGMDPKDIFDLRPAEHMQPMEVDGKPGWKIWKIRSKSGVLIDQPLASTICARWAARRKVCGLADPLHPMVRDFPDSEHFGTAFREALRIRERDLGLPLLGVKETRHTWFTRHLRRIVRREPGAPTLFELKRWGGWSPSSTVPETTYAKLVSESANPD